MTLHRQHVHCVSRSVDSHRSQIGTRSAHQGWRTPRVGWSMERHGARKPSLQRFRHAAHWHCGSVSSRDRRAGPADGAQQLDCWTLRLTPGLQLCGAVGGGVPTPSPVVPSREQEASRCRRCKDELHRSSTVASRSHMHTHTAHLRPHEPAPAPLPWRGRRSETGWLVGRRSDRHAATRAGSTRVGTASVQPTPSVPAGPRTVDGCASACPRRVQSTRPLLLVVCSLLPSHRQKATQRQEERSSSGWQEGNE